MADSSRNSEKDATGSTDESTPKPMQSRDSDKVGTSKRAARKVGSRDDFGIPVKQARPHDMRPDVGEKDVEDHEDDHRPISGASGDGQRTRGVGSKGRGKPGSGSGGDVDTDIIGVGDGGSTLSQTGPDEVDSEDVEDRS